MDSIHVRFDSVGTKFRVRIHIAVTQKVGRNKGDACKHKHGDWACNPS